MKKHDNLKKINEIGLSDSDFRFIIGTEWEIFENNIINNCYCANCKSNYNSTIANYTVILNDLNDIVLQGYCAKCGYKVGRYVETGDNEEYSEAISDVRRRYSKN